MDKMTKKIVGAFAAIIAVAGVILAVFFIVGRQDDGSKRSTLETLANKDLDNAYPGTPTELVKLYWRYNQFMYSKKLSDKEMETLMRQLRKLYDDELLAQDENSEENMLKNLKMDKENRGNETIVSTIVQKYESVKVETSKGESYATVYVAVNVKKSGKTSKFFESMRCRTDQNKKWKILGWKTATQQEAIKAGIE